MSSGRIPRRAWGFLAALGLISVSLANATLAPAATPPSATSLPPLSPGAVVALAGTTSLWVTDDQGVLHYAGDLRALVGRPVDWNTRVEVSPEELAALPRGDPWLSTALVRMGNAIYLPQW